VFYSRFRACRVTHRADAACRGCASRRITRQCSDTHASLVLGLGPDLDPKMGYLEKRGGISGDDYLGNKGWVLVYQTWNVERMLAS
jgi:hypothetical protein